MLLGTGIVFIEVDYLNFQPSTFPSLRDSLKPYHIAVLDARQHGQQGEARLYNFSVADALPTVNIPLMGEDTISLDFGIPYQATLEDTGFTMQIDYQQLPAGFDRYPEPDQAYIASLMLSFVDHTAFQLLPLETALMQLSNRLS